MKQISTRSIVFALFSLLLIPCASLKAQDIQAEYDAALEKWREAAVTASVAAGEFQLATRAESDAIKKRWRTAVAEGNEQLEKLKPLALQLFEQAETPNDELYQLVMRFMEHNLVQGNFSKANQFCDLLMSKDKPKDQETYEILLASHAKILVYTNRFEEAVKFKNDHPKIVSRLDSSSNATIMLYNAEQMRDLHQKELEIQKREAEADDLPRVEVKTTKGSFVIELFENEAPDTVGNFIFLIEKCRPAGAPTDEGSAYDGMIFHRVIDEFMAQTGGFAGSGQRAQIGWSIYDEHDKPDARFHFRGSVSMAKTAEPNSGNSQFFVTFIPTPGLNKRHTVFGRVISGMETVDRINRTHLLDEENEEQEIEDAVLDQIISVRVLRKRDHDYQPKRVEK